MFFWLFWLLWQSTDPSSPVDFYVLLLFIRMHPHTTTYSFTHPDMLKQYATCVSNGLHALGIDGQIEVYVDVWRSMNKRYQQRFVDPTVDLLQAPWSPYNNTNWVLPCLFDFDHQRKELDTIADRYSKENIEVVFVADFPNMSLEHYVNGTENSNVILYLMHGSVEIVFENGEIYAVPQHVNVSLPLDTTHTVKTVGTTPSRFMYAYEGRFIEAEEEEKKKQLLHLNDWDSTVYDWERDIEIIKNMTKYIALRSQKMWNETNPYVQFRNYITELQPTFWQALVLFNASLYPDHNLENDGS